jgi:hypothetical protein
MVSNINLSGVNGGSLAAEFRRRRIADYVSIIGGPKKKPVFLGRVATKTLENEPRKWQWYDTSAFPKPTGKLPKGAKVAAARKAKS